MEKNSILISIITIFKDEEKHLEATLSSMTSQSYLNFECILLDGGSSDASPTIASQYCTRDNRFRIYKQVSKGISNAFNEGIEKAKGDSIIFLNGGDLFSGENSLCILANKANSYPDCIIACRSEYINEIGTKTGKYIPQSTPQAKNLKWYCSFSHQSTLIPISVFDRIGGYRNKLKIAMDYEFWLRASRAKFKFLGFDDVVSYHRVGGVSFQQVNLSRIEVILSRWRYLSPLRVSIFKDVVQLMLVGLGKIRSL